MAPFAPRTWHDYDPVTHTGTPDTPVSAAGMVDLETRITSGFTDATTALVAKLASTDPSVTNGRVPTGTAAGDLSGTYPNPSVARIAGVTVTGTPTVGQVPTATSGTDAAWATPGTVSVPAAYTPVLTASTTNPALGTGGSALGRYIQIGKQVTYWFAIKFGTSGANAGSGYYMISVPVTAAALLASPTNLPQGDVLILCGGLSTRCLARLLDVTHINPLYNSAAVSGGLAPVSHNLPAAFTNNDYIFGSITYEAA